MPALAAVVFALTLLASGSPAHSAVLVPPVAAPVTAPFEAPECRWCPGHRGLSYATSAGTPVTAAADGVVTFAGTVAGTLYVVVLHAGDLRTTYGRLTSVAVAFGQHVRRGDPVGRSGAVLHFGARVGARYVDPATLFGGLARRARLLPLRS
jgi:murein DD-endopeptidase MepM/ murein hydrolase activator NlpD